MTEKTIFSPIGPITIKGTEEYLTGIFLGQSSTSKTDGDLVNLAAILIEEYLRGRRCNFSDIPLFLPEEYEWFLKLLSQIPYGKTVSYSELAEMTGLHPRAVGTYLRKNPFPIIIPCHRVIMKSGKIGGFSAGSEWKRFLLSIEGIFISR